MLVRMYVEFIKQKKFKNRKNRNKRPIGDDDEKKHFFWRTYRV